MKRFLRYTILLVLFYAISTSFVWAQTSISGSVQGDVNNEPIAGANVMLKNGNTFLAFSITKEDGSFTIQTQAALDTAHLLVTHLSYDDKRVDLLTDVSNYTITLSSRSYDLPELAITSDPIIQKGDTLVFDIEAFKRSSDRSLEDLLKRLPGISVETDGKVLYKGLPISRFYIEGLDMLGGNYSLATKNLNLNAVRDVEVLQNHQHVWALDSIVTPDNAAINIKLKSGIAMTGDYGLSVGATPARYSLKSNVLGFTKKRQFTLSGSSNNMGYNNKAQFSNKLVRVSAVGGSLIQLTKPMSPLALKKETYNDNLEHVAGFHYLQKAGNDLQVNLQGAFSIDRLLYQGITESQLFDGTSTVDIFNKKKTTLRPMEGKAKVILEQNSKKLYVRMDNKIEYKTMNGHADNVFNTIPSLEDQTNKMLHLDSDISTIVRVNNKAYQFDTEVKYHDDDYALSLYDIDVYTPEFYSGQLDEVNQNARTKKLDVHTHAAWHTRYKLLESSIYFGAKYQNNKLVSDLLSDGKVLNTLFTNDNSLQNSSAYINQYYEWQKGKHLIDVELPTSYSLINYVNNLESNKLNFNYLIAKPELTYRYQHNGNSISASYAYTQDVLSTVDYSYEGYILTSNRRASQLIIQPNIYQDHRVGVGFYTGNPMKREYLRGGLSYSTRTTDFLKASNYNSTGGTSSAFLDRDNQSTRLNARINSLVSLGNSLDIELKASYTHSTSEAVINDEELSTKTDVLWLSQYLSFFIDDHAFTIDGTWEASQTNVIDGRNHQVKFGLGYYYDWGHNISSKIDYEQYFNAFQSTRAWNNMLNAKVEYRFKDKQKMAFIQLYNITNQKYFTSYMQSYYRKSKSQFKLLGPQIRVGFKNQF